MNRKNILLLSAAEAMLAQKQGTGRIHERAYRNRPLSDEQKESNRQNSRIRARNEQVFGYMSQSMKGFYLRYIGRRRNAAAIGLINLIHNLARYESRFRIGTAAGRRLKSED